MNMLTFNNKPTVTRSLCAVSRCTRVCILMLITSLWVLRRMNAPGTCLLFTDSIADSKSCIMLLRFFNPSAVRCFQLCAVNFQKKYVFMVGLVTAAQLGSAFRTGPVAFVIMTSCEWWIILHCYRPEGGGGGGARRIILPVSRRMCRVSSSVALHHRRQQSSGRWKDAWPVNLWWRFILTRACCPPSSAPVGDQSCRLRFQDSSKSCAATWAADDACRWIFEGSRVNVGSRVTQFDDWFNKWRNTERSGMMSQMSILDILSHSSHWRNWFDVISILFFSPITRKIVDD